MKKCKRHKKWQRNTARMCKEVRRSGKKFYSSKDVFLAKVTEMSIIRKKIVSEPNPDGGTLKAAPDLHVQFS